MSKLSLAALAGAAVFLSFTGASARAEVLQSSELRGARGEPLCVDVAGGQGQDGANLVLHPCHGRANQSFTYHQDTGEIRSALGNYCVDVSWGAAFHGARVQLWTCNGLGAQNFDYEPRTGRMVYRAERSLCLDVRDDGEASLRSCAERATQRFSLNTRYGKARFHELTFVAAHNAFANNEDSSYVAVNQSHSIQRILEDGVRGLMLDAHSFESGTARCVASFGQDCYRRDVYMCHGGCGGVPGVAFGFPRRTLAEALRTIVSFLRARPEEIVTVLLEDLISRDELARVLDSVPGLRDLMFDPYAWNVQRNGWPRASSMVYANDRLLIISDRSDKTDLGVAYARDFTVENYWSLGSTSADYSCKTRWGNVALDRKEAAFERLFVMNHFRDIPLPANAKNDNSRGTLTWRMNEHCVPAARRKPNFVAVDFYENGDTRQVVSEVNDAVAILYEHGDFGGRAQLLRPGQYAARDLGLGNDLVSSVQVAQGARVTLFEHDGFAGRQKTLGVTASGLWDFNDMASSVQVFRDPADTVQHRAFSGDFDGDGKSDQLVYYAGTGEFWLGRGQGARLAWSSMGNVAGFGSLLDGRHAMFAEDFTGDGRTDLLMYFNGDGNLWLGRSEGHALTFGFAGNVASLGNLLSRSRQLHTGDYNGDGKADLAFYFRDNGDVFFGLSDGAQLSFARAANLASFGDLLDENHAFYAGDFDGNGMGDLAFYAADTGELWFALSTGSQLGLTRAASVPGFGNLLDARHRVFVGDFDGDGKTDIAFYSAGNGDWWLGRSTGATLTFGHAGNVGGFGNLLEQSRALRSGDFNGDGKTDLMFYYAGDGNLWLGTSDGERLGFRWAGAVNDFGNLLDEGRMLGVGDYDGDGRTDLLSYASHDRSFRYGRSTGVGFEWAEPSDAPPFGDLFR